VLKVHRDSKELKVLRELRGHLQELKERLAHKVFKVI
jgi:hypothetical protein